ncbi:N-acetylmuramoyl-L-alanine amidase [Candidatus Dependentiae bacterium]|nr:N-acetylmuramoyl-L-alanine amidase [Candidatus Dependentiae bacterium]
MKKNSKIFLIILNIRRQAPVIFFVLLIGSWMSIRPWSFFTPETPVHLQNISPRIPPFFTLLINPAGDAKDTGREIDGTFERGITMQCASELKKALEERISGLRVILTRFPGEVIEPLQNASFANRLTIDLYLSLHFFQHSEKLHRLFLYHVLYNPEIDVWEKKSNELVLLPYDQAYTLSIKRTIDYGTELFKSAKSIERAYNIVCHKLQGLPFKPLAGISAPSVAFECGIRKKDDWKPLVPFLVTLLEPIITRRREL